MFDIKNRWLLFGLVSLSIIVNVYFRLDTLFLSPFDRTTRKEIHNNIYNNLLQQTYSLYPEMPNKTREKMCRKLFSDFLRNDKQRIRQVISERSKERKAYYQDERGWTYLLETDSYRWLRRIENYLNTKQFGSRRVDNQEYDDLEFAPQGDKIESSRLFFYSEVYFYKLLHIINNKLSLANCLSLIPVILSAVLVLAVFWICILFGMSYWGAFLASLVLGLSPWALLRTSFGWFDTDIYNLFIPVIIISVLACSFRQTGFKSRILMTIAGGLLGVYSSVWSVWWLFFYILFVGMFIYELSFIISDKQNNLLVKIKPALLDIFLFIFSVYLSVLLISGLEAVKQSFSEPFSYFSLRGLVTIDNFWPNTAFSVAELGPADIPKIILYIGGRLIFYGGLIGVLLVSLLQRKKMYFKERAFLQFSLSVWLLVTLILTFSARRFVLFLTPPLAIFFCAGLDMLFRLMNQKQIPLSLNNNKKYSLLLMVWESIKLSQPLKINLKNHLTKGNFLVCIFLSIAIIPLNNAYRQNLFSILTFINNDSWQNMLMTIKKDTPADAIINTDWTQGDLIMSVGKRATVQDAHWQYNAVFFWFNYALLTDNEEEAFGIIRMINSGGNRAYEELLKILDYNKLASFELIKRMLVLTEEDGRALLTKYTQDKDTINKILKFIYGGCRPIYLVVHNSMIRAMYDFSKIGNWDFKRGDLWQKFSSFGGDNFKRDFTIYGKMKLGYSVNEIESLYTSFVFTDEADIVDWISKGAYEFYTNYSEQSFFSSDGKIAMFENGIVIDRDNLKAYFCDIPNSKWMIPGQLIFVDKKGMVKENVNQQGDKDYSILFSEGDNTCKAIMFSRPLAQSIFFKLYFLDGRGLKHFKLIKREYNKAYGTDIYLYNVIK